MKKQISLKNKPATERAIIDARIADKFGIEFLVEHGSVPLFRLNQLALENRQKAPKNEYLILNELRRRGYNVQHQHPVLYRYIPDMVHFGSGKNYVIEIDGPSHEGRRFQDRERSMLLEFFGFEVMRFESPRNSVVLGKIINQIERVLKPWKQNKPLVALERPNQLFPKGVQSPLFQTQLDLAKSKKLKNG